MYYFTIACKNFDFYWTPQNKRERTTITAVLLWLFICGFLLEKSVFCFEIYRFFDNSGTLSRFDVCVLVLVYYFVFQ